MDGVFIVTTGLLLVYTGAHHKVRSFAVRFRKYIAFTILTLTFIALFIENRTLFLAWSTSEPSKFLLPPYTSLAYFIKYSVIHIYSPYLLSLLFALFIYILIQLIPATRREILFEADEALRITIAIFLLAHPLWLIYFIVALGLYAGYGIIAGRTKRVSFSLIWLPLALLCKLTALFVLKIPFVASLGLIR